jgi:predicted metalloprotease with PDZ domain
MSEEVQYTLRVASHHAHHFEITIDITAPTPKVQRLSCPRWIPGSYLLRDFAKHILQVTAADGAGKAYDIKKVNNWTWEVANPPAHLSVTVLVYAWDFSVRGAHLDHLHAFYNPVVGCLMVEGKANQPLRFEVEAIDSKPHWQCATGMRPLAVNENGFGQYVCRDYDELVDCPLEMGELDIHSFTINQKAHRIVLSGVYEGSAQRLVNDVEKICKSLQDWMGAPSLDFETYTFLCHLTHNSYGGLEHCSSSALMAPRKFMPRHMNAPVDERYATLLGLFSHEYFHNWFIKRIKPTHFTPYQYHEISLTEQLWIFEGFTSYYDDLCLVRAGVVSREQYLSAMAQSITRYLKGPGHQVQTVTESSFDAWIKFYQPNENTNNAVVSYYVKGGLIALCCDALIREQTQHEKSLDDVVRHIWQQYHQKGVPEKAIEQEIIAVGGQVLADFLEKALYTTEPLPLAKCLAVFSIELTWVSSPASGAFARPEPIQGIHLDAKKRVIKAVTSHSAAEKAGLAPNDILVAINNYQFAPEQLSDAAEGMALSIHFFRDGVLRETTLIVASEKERCVKLSFVQKTENSSVVASWLKS